jgi:hypothetical protein
MRNSKKGKESGNVTGRSGIKVQDPAEAKKEMARAMMIDFNFEFNLGITGIVDRLGERIPFKNIDIESLTIDQKDDETNNCPEGVMKDSQYNYCYKNLLIETKEWYTTL